MCVCVIYASGCTYMQRTACTPPFSSMSSDGSYGRSLWISPSPTCPACDDDPLVIHRFKGKSWNICNPWSMFLHQICVNIESSFRFFCETNLVLG